jgi:hypothetical protein
MAAPAIVTEKEPQKPAAPPPAPREPKGRVMAAFAGALFLAAIPLGWATTSYARSNVIVDTSAWDLAFVASALLGAAGAFFLAFTRSSRVAPPLAVLTSVPGLFMGFLPWFSGYFSPPDVQIVPNYGAVVLVAAGVLGLWAAVRAFGRFARKAG